MSEERKPSKELLEQLLQAYPEISVYRSQEGFFEIFRQVSPNAERTIGVVVRQNRLAGNSTEIIISGSTLTKQDQEEERKAKVITLTPSSNPNTYIIIKRPEGAQLEAEVIYPQDESKRIDPSELLSDAVHGLEIFDTFQHISSQEKERYSQRIVDEMSDFDSESYGRMVRRADQGTGFEEFLAESGFDARLIEGQPKMALLLMRRISSLPITKVSVNH